ncbi:MAG: DUF4173 domain-containing protein [Chthoniobacteraceae bacterium]|nr:DUF4173 domain-containing protein [Chthoniobacteraceae bacterium]
MVFGGDFLLWGATPGLSWGVFVVALGGALAVNRPRGAWSRTAVVFAGLLLLSAAQSAVEISFSNVLVSLALLAGLVGETSYPGLRSGWERNWEAFLAFAKAPGRLAWALARISELARKRSGVAQRVLQGVSIGLPALMLGILFAGLLGEGNAIFGSWITESFQAIENWICSFDLSFWHCAFYGALAAAALAVLQPAAPGRRPRLWTRPIPRFPAGNVSTGWWRSVAILAVLNGLFFVVNTLDALYLWTQVHLPAGVTYSQYVHDGVGSLVAAVLLSAAVLAVLFQQDAAVSGSPALKRLGYLWIAQNGILIAGVMLRLIRYIEACLLTTQRVYVLLFVALVAAGFVLLAVHIARNGSLNGLILSNGVAVLALFFAVQFLNVPGWVARYNVAAWERNPKRSLDVGYLESLGDPAWTALSRVAASRHPQAASVRGWLEQVRKNERRALDARNWRSWQGRHAWNAAWLLKQG